MAAQSCGLFPVNVTSRAQSTTPVSSASCAVRTCPSAAHGLEPTVDRGQCRTTYSLLFARSIGFSGPTPEPGEMTAKLASSTISKPTPVARAPLGPIHTTTIAMDLYASFDVAPPDVIAR